jgi:hypothetical protein
MEGPSSSDLIFEQRISTFRKSISILIEWVIFGVLVIIYNIVASNAASNEDDMWLNTTYQILGVAVWSFLFFLAFYTYETVRDLRYIAWSDYRLRCLIQLEVFPDVQGSVEGRVMNKVTEIYPTINYFPAQKGIKFDASATRLIRERWDIVIDLNAMEKLDTAKYVLVKIMRSGEVGVDDLKRIGWSVFKLRLLKPISTVEAVFIVSPTGFRPEAVDMIGRGKIWGFPRLGTRLVLVNDKGFRLEL